MQNSNYTNITKEQNEEAQADSNKDESSTNHINYIKKLNFRNKLSYLLIGFTFGLSGVSDLAVQYCFKDIFKLEPAELSRIMFISWIPWYIKPIFGLITDTIPLFNYRRKTYIILCGIVDIICMFLLSFVDKNITIFLTLLFLHNSCQSFSTMLGEAVIVELSKISSTEEAEDNSAKTKSNISFFFFVRYTGSLISAVLKGIVVKYLKFSTIFIICSFIPVLLVISGLNLIEQKYNTKLKNSQLTEKTNIDIYSESDKDSINTDEKIHLTNSKIFLSYLFQKKTLIPLLFTMIVTSVPRYGDTMFYFFTEELKLDSVDLGIISIFSMIAILTAIAIYRKYLKKKSFKCIVTSATLIYFFFSFFAFILVIRYNLILGVPDLPFVLLATTLVNLIFEIIAMPITSIGALLSPKNFEGTSISIFISASNLGLSLSHLFGSFITDMLNITSKDFNNLPKQILISNFLILVPLPILFCIDNKYFEILNSSNERKNEDIKPVIIELTENESVGDIKM